MKTLLPEINSSDKRFHNGDPATGEQGTRVTDTWLNDVQDRVRDVQAEAHYVLLKAGFRPVENKQTQLYEAIVKIIDDNRKKASTTQKGEVQLYSGYDSESEEMAATPKVIKILKGFIDSITRSLTNYIPNSKKSSSVNSNSNDTVATSAAVKTAYDLANAALPLNNEGSKSVVIGNYNFVFQTDGNLVIANKATNEVLYAANRWVSKLGDTITGILRTSGIASSQFGFGSYAHQYTSGAPFMVEETNANQKDTYYPIAKGRFRKQGQYGTAVSFGYTTKQGNGDGFGTGITINLIEDNGAVKNWLFQHSGDFVSAGDVRSLSGKSINNSVQISELVGEVAFFARSTPPSGWLKANGAAVSRTTYAALFDAIGTTFGDGDGHTTFNLPDLRGEFLRGLDDGRNVDGGRRLGTTQGDAIRNITGKLWSEFSGYKYVITTNSEGVFALTDNDGRRDTFKGDVANYGQLNKKVEFNASRVVPTANENRPRNVALLACIKY
jgi:probable tail fiber protein|nr:MAG TPA: tail collar fiber protein [Caudoviricetes sp.]